MAANLLSNFCERQQIEHHPERSLKNVASKKKILNKMLCITKCQEGKGNSSRKHPHANVKSHDKPK